jgi:mannose-6-phosphate isomerase-like protein (cupin superfamily)
MVAHGGTGEIEVARLVADDGPGGLNFIDLAVVPPGCGIGVHRHAQDEEEYYLVLEGSALMSLGGDEVRVEPGDLIRNPPGGAHGLFNDGEVPVRLFVFEVRA